MIEQWGMETPAREGRVGRFGDGLVRMEGKGKEDARRDRGGIVKVGRERELGVLKGY